MLWFVSVADWVGIDKLLCVFFKAGPPEPLEEDGTGSLDPRVAGELGGMGPLQHIGPQG